MSFRNPVRTIPASKITGQIQGTQLAADAIDGKVITGATIRTATGVPRVELGPDGNLYFYPRTWPTGTPARLLVDGTTNALQLIGPNGGAVDYGFTLQKFGGVTSMTIDPDTVGILGALSAGNVVAGRVTITPSAANTPTSTTITGLSIAGTGSVRALATASTIVPGTEVTGIGCTGVSHSQVIIWVTRTNTTPTNVDYFLWGT